MGRGSVDSVRGDWRTMINSAADRLRAAGVESADSDVRQLLAFVLDLEPSGLLLVDAVSDHDQLRFESLVAQRVQRVPLQHLTGRAYFRHVELLVGPGVFVPRPETEVMTGWAIDQLRRPIPEPTPFPEPVEGPIVVELCAGSGAISKAIADEVPGVEIHAVELSEDAGAWAIKNLAGTGVELIIGDMADAFGELNGRVDLVIANPPYIPLEAYESVTPEVRDHDPMVALFSGDDGLDAMRVVADVAARLLREGGVVCAEHAEVQVESAPQVFLESGDFSQVRDNVDLSGRPRFVTAVRAPLNSSYQPR